MRRRKLLRTVWIGALLSAACSREPPEPPRFVVERAASVDASAVPLLVLRDERAGIEAAVAPSKGGELSGLAVRCNGSWVETLYRARDYSPVDGFRGKGPWLWPATGRNFPPDLEARRRDGERFDNGAWEHGGARRPMPIHGFAQNAAWSIVEGPLADGGGARVVLGFEDDERTLEWYPFGFRAAVEYVLTGGRLEMRYGVAADEANREPMFFSIGNHIAFAAPLLAGGDPAKMELTTPSSVELLKTDYGIPTGETQPRSYAGGVELGELPPLKPISLAGYPPGEAPWIEYRDPAGLTVRMEHSASQTPDAPVVLFNLWGDPRAGFYSPEPWVGLQNSLVSRKGLIYLEPGEEFDWTVIVSFSRRIAGISDGGAR